MHTLNRFLNFFRHNPKEFYLYILFVVFLAVFFINFPYNKSLIGWDNLLSELNFSSNIQRGVFSLWQENEGLGLIGGHGFASTLPHTIFQLVFSVLLPTNYLRPFFFLIMLLLGSVGAFFLTDILLPGINATKKGLASLAAGLFYMLNFATIQMFYIPLEAFAIHFAFLPWLLFLAVSIFKTPRKKYFFWFTIFSLLSSHQGFIPPLFLIYLIFLGVLSLFYFLKNKSKKVFYLCLTVFLITITTNAYWLFPIAFYTKNRSDIYLNSYNNLTTTDDFLLKSTKFGDLNSLITLKSFLSDAVDAFPQGENRIFNIFEPWKTHLDSPSYIVPSYLFFALILLGIFYSYKKKSFWLIAFTSIFALTFIFMASDVPGLSILSDILRNHVPIFKQAFRIAFTKFSTSLSLFYAIFLGVGIYSILEIFPTHKKYLTIISSVLIFTLLIALGLPAFSGYFFYNRTKLTLPDNYRQLFEFFKKEDPNTRIADFPQFIPTGWLIYNWGYSGSGFLWYGLPQPILDRNFDVWNNFNENYYWEIAQGIYSQNTTQFENTIKKYNIHYLLVDPSVIGYVSPKTVSLDKFLTLISSSNILKLVNTFGNIQVYEVENPDILNNFVSIRNNLPIISPQANWNNYDKAYEDYGNYISNSQYPISNFQLTDTTKLDIFYPFRSLFTGRTQEDIEFKVDDKGNYFSFTSTIPKEMAGSKLVIPQFDNDEIDEINPTDFSSTPKLPQIYLDGELIPATTNGEITLNYIKEGQLEIRVPKINGYYSANLQPFDYAQDKPTSCDTFNTGTMTRQLINNMVQFNSVGSSNCLDIDLPNLSQRLGYLISVKNQNVEGKSLLFSIVNKNSQRADTETYLPKKQTSADSLLPSASYFIQPPMEDFGRGYVLHLDNISIGRVRTINNLGEITVNPIPYRFLTSLKIVSPNYVRDPSQRPQDDSVFQVEHPNPSYYKVEFNNLTMKQFNNEILMLSQSFDNGWKAYETKCTMNNWQCTMKEFLPFIFGKEIKDHVLVNNWENGWKLGNGQCTMGNEQCTIMIYYMPQVLEFIGFGLLPLPFIFLLVSKLRKHPHHPSGS